MNHQGTLVSESFPTRLTGLGPLAGVLGLVVFQGLLQTERLVADGTLEGFQAGVYRLVIIPVRCG